MSHERSYLFAFSFLKVQKMNFGFLIFYHVVRFIQGIIGGVGNVAVIVVISRFKAPSNSYVMMLCVALVDFLSCILGRYLFALFFAECIAIS